MCAVLEKIAVGKIVDVDRIPACNGFAVVIPSSPSPDEVFNISQSQRCDCVFRAILVLLRRSRIRVNISRPNVYDEKFLEGISLLICQNQQWIIAPLLPLEPLAVAAGIIEIFPQTHEVMKALVGFWATVIDGVFPAAEWPIIAVCATTQSLRSKQRL